MSDLQTMVKQLLREVHIDTTASGSQAETDAKISIIESIRYNRRFHFWFTEKEGTILTEANQWQYPVPLDLLQMLSDPFYIDGTASSDFRNQLRQETWEWMNEHYNRVAEWQSTVNTGSPRRYHMDLVSRKIWLLPIPNETGNSVIFRYHKDCGTPSYKYTGSAWAFYKPNSEDALPDAFSNEWFTEGYHLIYARASYLMWSRPYGGTQEATIMSQQSLQQWAEELNRLRGETTGRSAQPAIRRHI